MPEPRDHFFKNLQIKNGVEQTRLEQADLGTEK